MTSGTKLRPGSVGRVGRLGLQSDAKPPPSTPGVVALGIAVETDTALPITPVSAGLSVALGLPTETDTALSITPQLAGGGATIPLFAHHYSQLRDSEVLTLKQSTASQAVLIGPFVDSTDGVTAETGLTINAADIRLSKNGGNMVAKNSGGGTHDENGWYQITLDATDTDTVGRLQISCVVAGALPVHAEFQVIEEAVYDQAFLAGADGVMDANVLEINSDATVADRLQQALQAVVEIEAAAGGSTTTIVAQTIEPATTEDDQLNGRWGYFLDDTTTAALRGQKFKVTDYVHSTSTFTIESEAGGALTEAVADGDTAILSG